MSPARLQQRFYDMLRRFTRASAWTPRMLVQPRRPEREVAIDPLVTGLTADAVVIAQIADRKSLAQIIRDELRFLVHGTGLTPRHRAPPAAPCLVSNCYLCVP